MSNSILTPYGAHTLVNTVLEAEGLTKRIPPQMMYNYTKGRIAQGKKPLIAFTPEGGVDRKDLERWLNAYVAKQKAAVAPVEEVIEVEVEGPSEAEMVELEAEFDEDLMHQEV